MTEKETEIEAPEVKKLVPAKHPHLKELLKLQAEELRELAERIAVLAPSGQTGASDIPDRLWRKAWAAECVIVAERVCDAARVLDQTADSPGPIHALLDL